MFVGALPDALAFGVEQVDLTKRDTLERIFALHKPNTVINCAAYTDVDAAEEHEDLATQINGDGVRHLAEIAHTFGARVVHFSTDYVFAGTNVAGYAEAAEPKPLNAYGRSKLVGEQALQQETDDFLLIRTAWLYGPNGKNFVDAMREKMKRGEAVRVVNDQEGSPTYTHDLAQATLHLIWSSAETGIYHLVNSGRTTWFDFAMEIQEVLGTAVQIDAVPSDAFPRPAKRPSYSVLVSTKKNTPDLRTWKEALKSYLTLDPIR